MNCGVAQLMYAVMQFPCRSVLQTSSQATRQVFILTNNLNIPHRGRLYTRDNNNPNNQHTHNNCCKVGSCYGLISAQSCKIKFS